MQNNELMHHGVKGMRWGVRRYTNKDGSLTNAGKKRYAKEMAKLRAEEKKLKNTQATQAKMDKLMTKQKQVDELRNATAKSGKKVKEKSDKQMAELNDASKKKSIKDMSNEELQAAITRKQLENNYLAAFPKEISKGKKFTNYVLNEIVIPEAKQYGKKIIDSQVDKVMIELGLKQENKYAKAKAQAEYLENLKRIQVAEDYFKKRKNQ